MIYRTSLSAPVFGLRREIDKLFEDTFSRGDGMNAWNPVVDVAETDRELTVDLELPGIRPEEIEITANNGVLTVRGEKRGDRKEGTEESRYHLVERSYGSFTRSFQLPQGLDEDKIEAEYNNGILAIHIPKAALPQPRKIEIGRRATQDQISSSGHEQSNGNRNAGGNGRSNLEGEHQSAQRSKSSPTRQTQSSQSQSSETQATA